MSVFEKDFIIDRIEKYNVPISTHPLVKDNWYFGSSEGYAYVGKWDRQNLRKCSKEELNELIEYLDQYSFEKEWEFLLKPDKK